MDMSVYLLLGLVTAGLCVYRVNLPILGVVCFYWLVIASWALGLTQPFSLTPISWVSAIEANISYHIDGLSQLFSLLISGIGVIVFIYAWIYTQHDQAQRPKLFSLLQIFAVSMLVVVLADDLLMLFVGWELTSIISYLLIQFKVSDPGANRAAFNSLFVSVIGGLILLVGFIVLNQQTGSWAIAYTIKELASANFNHPMLVLSLILCGVITKSAQFPFYFWLTGAMKAPTPVSAYLHSATMVNAGIYLLARFHPMLSEISAWYSLLSTFGLITMALSSFLSMFQRDLKAILAYTTIFALGAMVYLLGGNNPIPIEAFAIFLLFHAIYKAGAFMLVGTIDKEYKTRNIRQLSGIARNRPSLSISTVIIFGAMAGLPPFFGFTVKEMIFEAKLAGESVSFILMGISIVSSMLIAAASFRCLWYFFLKHKETITIKTQMRFGFISSLFLAALILLFSLFGRQVEMFISPVVQAIMPSPQFVYLNPNTTLTIMLSLGTVAGGVAIFLLYLFTKKYVTSLPWHWSPRLTLTAVFEKSFAGLLKVGKALTVITQGQSLSTQLRIGLLTIVLVLVVFASQWWSQWAVALNFPKDMSNALACVFLILSGLSLLLSRRFLYNLISLSLVGFASSFYFVVNGAVDVAITQLLVEVLTIIILLMALRAITTTPEKISTQTQVFNALTAVAVGAVFTGILLLLNRHSFDTVLQQYYAKNSLLVAYGKNIVNVILVDFRSFDTFGEVMVIVATAVGIALLTKKHARSSRREDVDLS